MAVKDQSQSGERADAKLRTRHTSVQDAHTPERPVRPGEPVRRAPTVRSLLAPRDIIRLQRTLGNRHVSKLLAGSYI